MQPIGERLRPTRASMAQDIRGSPGSTIPEHDCICQIHAFMAKWLLERKLVPLNGWGAIPLITPLHKPEYVLLALTMILNKDPDFISYSTNNDIDILRSTQNEETLQRCFRASRAPPYTIPRRTLSGASPSPSHTDRVKPPPCANNSRLLIQMEAFIEVLPYIYDILYTSS